LLDYLHTEAGHNRVARSGVTTLARPSRHHWLFGLHKVGVHLARLVHARIVVADSSNDGGWSVVAGTRRRIPESG